MGGKARQRKANLKEGGNGGKDTDIRLSSTRSDGVSNSSTGAPFWLVIILLFIIVILLSYVLYPNIASLLRHSDSVQSKREITSESEEPTQTIKTGSDGIKKDTDIPQESQRRGEKEKRSQESQRRGEKEKRSQETQPVEKMVDLTPDTETAEKVVKLTPESKSGNKNVKTASEKSRKKSSSKESKEIEDFKASYLKEMSPKKIFVDGRRLPPVELLPQKPNNSSVKVFLYDEFLSKEECEGLMKAHNRHVEEMSKKDPIICFDSVNTLRRHLKANNKKVKVTPLDFTPGTTCVNKTFSSQLKVWLKNNWSYSTAFYPGESRFSQIFEYRVKEATALTPTNGGKFQITSYPEGIGYKTHTDCREDDEERDRMATILVYLQDVEDGGETKFPELGIWAKPRKGRALVWNNMNKEAHCEPLSIHNAAKVIKGHKYILQRWYYYKNFYSLGKRPPEPHLPEREPGTPRVSCDEYDHGSCRWYDEWNYDHILEYQRQKMTLQ